MKKGRKRGRLKILTDTPKKIKWEHCKLKKRKSNAAPQRKVAVKVFPR
jgi:hypothetical protein